MAGDRDGASAPIGRVLLVIGALPWTMTMLSRASMALQAHTARHAQQMVAAA
jgi:hypothetical protein